MLVFILDAADGKLAQRTEDGIAAACAGCRFVRVAAGAAATMNRVLTDYAEPFFATFTAGDAVQPEFFEYVARSLPSLGPKDAGIVALPVARKPNPAEEPSAPIVWRTEAVRSSGGFAEPDLLPFERYVLPEKKLQLDPFHTWKTVPADGFLPKPRRNLGWHKTAREWRELKPLLSGTNTSPLENERPLLSIVLCTYNNADDLLWAVRSVRVQTCRDWELIVADDGSTDRTQRILDEHPLLMDSRVRVLRIERNRGKAHALNSALSAARGQWLMELDADDWLAPDCASAIAARARDDDRAGAIYADCVEWRELSGKRLVYAGIRSIAEPLDAWRLLEQPFPLAPRAFRIALLRRLGGWLVTDPFDGRLYEDLQMLARVMQERPLLRIPQALYNRRIRLSSVTQRNKANYPAWKAWMRETLLRERPDD